MFRCESLQYLFSYYKTGKVSPSLFNGDKDSTATPGVKSFWFKELTSFGQCDVYIKTSLPEDSFTKSVMSWSWIDQMTDRFEEYQIDEYTTDKVVNIDEVVIAQHVKELLLSINLEDEYQIYEIMGGVLSHGNIWGIDKKDLIEFVEFISACKVITIQEEISSLLSIRSTLKRSKTI